MHEEWYEDVVNQFQVAVVGKDGIPEQKNIIKSSQLPREEHEDPTAASWNKFSKLVYLRKYLKGT